MLSFTVAFYYSKSTVCIRQLSEYLGCPPPIESVSGTTVNCFGFFTTLDLVDGELLMPEEIDADSFECSAFPQATLLGRVTVGFVIAMLLFPVQTFYAHLFNMIGNHRHSKGPAFLVRREVLAPKVVMTGQRRALVQSCFYAMYTISFQFQKFNKALALCFVAVFGYFFAPPKWLLVYVKWILVRFNVLYKVWKMMLCRGLGQEVSLVPPSWADEPSRVAAYSVFFLGWMMGSWILFTFVAQIRATEGSETVQLIMTTWGITLAIEQFGKEGLKLTLMKVFVNWSSTQVDALLGRKSKDTDKWLDTHMLSLTQASDADPHLLYDDERLDGSLDADFEGDEANNVDADVDVDVDVDS